MLRRFFAYYRPYKGQFTLDFGCAVLSALLDLLFPLVVGRVTTQLVPSKHWSLILWAGFGMLAIYLINSGFKYIVSYYGHKLGISIETDMRRKLFDHIQKLSFRFFDNNETGRLISRVTSDLFEIGELAHHGPEDVFIASMTLVAAFFLMLMTNWKLALLTFFIVPALVWLEIYCGRKMTRAMRRIFTDIAHFNARTADAVSGIRVVQAFANEAHEQEQFAIHNRRYRQTKLYSYKVVSLNDAVSYLLTSVVSLFELICGAWFIIHHQLTYGGFIEFLLLTNILLQPIRKISSVLENYPKGVAGFQRYLEILETAPDVADAPDAVEVTHLKGDICYNHVSFGYEEHMRVFRDVNLQIHAGETVAFVGPSGAGKTTLCSLLPRFYEIEAGNITIDGMDICKMTLASLRRQIGIVQQDVFIFAGTLRENIVYGKMDATEAEIWEAVHRAQLDEFVRSLPQGLDSVVGERGVKLSGGQKQRLSIARMFLKNPPVLILDEATSALDTVTEMAIQQSLAELSRGRTTLVVAHRLATIRNADRIVVVTQNGIVEQGSHQELVQSGGLYSQLHRAQYSS
ncbi:ABC transporter ATP-binding protein [Alicyclobacillus fodiniaquatilis]|uniref:ABC transporter ATP-binding protein n=1 Tax=Alicyclobacillus fodiniaquatilis TaxID=1661150 RepID=A0ABW4JM87_9BACL